jgi:hypothetical protein
MPMSQNAPPPVYAEETDMNELGPAEVIVVAALRLWVGGARRSAGPLSDWRGILQIAGIADPGVTAFGCLMDIVAGTAIRTILVRPRFCRMLGCDEGRLLQLASLLQHGRGAVAAEILGEWLPPEAAALAERVAAVLAVALAEANLVLPLRHSEAASIGSGGPGGYAMPGLALLQ